MFEKKRKKKGIIILSVAFVLAVLLAGSVFYILKKYTVQTVYVKGNMHYTQEEIQDLVMTGPLGHNSLYLSFQYSKKGVENIPFVDAMDVNILSPDTIEILVYEKALAGCIAYMDSYMYFDRDGYVVEYSNILTPGVPQITGLDFDHAVLGERLPVQDEKIFDSIMDLKKLLDKYELTADKIYFHSSDDITVYFGDVKVALGDDRSNLENKVMRLPQLLAKLEGEAGTLRMENLTEDKTGVTFQKSGE